MDASELQRELEVRTAFCEEVALDNERLRQDLRALQTAFFEAQALHSALGTAITALGPHVGPNNHEFARVVEVLNAQRLALNGPGPSALLAPHVNPVEDLELLEFITALEVSTASLREQAAILESKKGRAEFHEDRRPCTPIKKEERPHLPAMSPARALAILRRYSGKSVRSPMLPPNSSMAMAYARLRMQKKQSQSART
eukprot:TRINITY_DN3121_c0_g1_i1.p1 TRINITY_DN3121_c0_g1~~TRINITY_DN3121_c0_g1_i1.p1  ORF type:complete len:200 (-),score=30.25 TRINITY_DN3121_c0_g1_i1:13-612(-)